jgi:hypothetical protein
VWLRSTNKIPELVDGLKTEEEYIMKLNIQRFAEEEIDDEEVKDPQNEGSDEGDDTNNDGGETKKSENKKSFVKIREEKAREKVFKDLGVKDLDEAKDKLDKAEQALKKIEEIEKKLQAQEADKVYSNKVNELTKILNDEKVFDADALVNYVDLDAFDLVNGKISKEDAKAIVASLKELKPNYFGKEFIKGDVYKKSQNKDVQNPDIDYQTDYEAGNYQAVIAKFLKNNKK